MDRKLDRELGMDRPITRRDFLHGLGTVTATTMLPINSKADDPKSIGERLPGSLYPPELSGLRGNHQGSFEVIHKLARGRDAPWGAVSRLEPDYYDLVVVGAGISGLSAAYFFQKERPDARILLLDNHDDFGGHAKRNEFRVDGHKLLAYGGAQTMQEPSSYPLTTKRLLKELGVNIGDFDFAYDQQFYKRHKLTGGIYFNKDKWGADSLIPFDIANFRDWMPLAEPAIDAKSAVKRMPISDSAKRQLLGLLELEEDQIPHLTHGQKWDYLYTLSYKDFLKRHLKVTEQEVFDIFQDLTSDSGVGIDSVAAASALWGAGMPGWDAAGLPEVEPEEAYIHHFPDGNASIARQLVRKMIPQAASGNTIKDLVTSVFDYTKLDQQDASVRIRLDSTVVDVRHHSAKNLENGLSVTYVRDAQAHRIKAKAVVMACDNAVIPYICPELPATQREALSFQVKVPILYTNVALRNWRAWKSLGVGAVVCPDSYHINASLDFPVSFGGYNFSEGPDYPVVVHMERFPHRSNQGLTPKEQFRLGRNELMKTSFETIERSVRLQLGGMLEGGGFDPARDIAAITCNRWAHGYAYWYRSLYDDEYDDDDDPRYPHMIARKRYGRIAIANADSGASPMMETAIEQGYRAVSELL